MSQRPPNLRAANLNLVPVLRALLREASVTKAAATLGLSPSATSCALAELRLLLDDPLLVRVGRVMRRTPRAEQLSGKLEHACAALEDLLQDAVFDPSTAQRVFVVAALDYVSWLIGASLITRLRQAAPRVQVRFVDVPGDLERQLALGAVDVGLVAVNHLNWSGTSAAQSCRDHLVGVVHSNHDLGRQRRPSAARLQNYPAVTWSPGFSLTARANAARLNGAPMRPDAPGLFQSINALPLLALEPGIVALAPRALARRMGQILPLRYFELPYEPLVIETGALWSAIQDSDPAHAWFRQIVVEALIEAHSPQP